MSIDCELKMQQNGILEAYILKFFPYAWEHAPRAPYRFAPSALDLWVQLCHPQTSFFTWQGCNL